MGPAITNIGNYIRLPSGCSEQLLVNLVPTCYVMDYLQSINRLSDSMKKTGIGFIEVGVSEELNNKQSDGSYKGFAAEIASTWLTAFIAKVFNQATQFYWISRDNIKSSLDWLKGKQNSYGEFVEDGSLYDRDSQSNVTKGVTMTAFVLITFLESNYKDNYQSVINKASNYIGNSLSSISSEPYPLAISTYALQLAKHQKKDEFLEKLNSIGRTRDEKKFWQRAPESSVSAIDREMTAYALLAHVAAGKVSEAIPIMTWLVEQRNSNGGFESSQETVVGLQALAQMAKKIDNPNSNVTILLNGQEFRQKIELDANKDSINVQVKGNGGMALVQISYEFNVLRNESSESASFPIYVTPRLSNNNNTLNLKVCTRFNPTHGENVQKTNMAMIEVSMPSGFKFDTSTKDGLINTNKIWVRN